MGKCKSNTINWRREKKKKAKQLKRREKMSGKRPPQTQGKRMPLPRGIAPNLLPGISIDHLTPIHCKNCGGEVFLQSSKLAMASPLHTVNGMPTLVNFPLGYACMTCNKVNDFDHPDLRPPEEKEPVLPPEEPVSSGGDLGISVTEDIKTKEVLK